MGAWEWKKSVCLMLVLGALGAVQVWSQASRSGRREAAAPWLPAARPDSSGIRVRAGEAAALPPLISKEFPDSDQEYFVLAPPTSYTGMNRARYANARNYENRATRGTKNRNHCC